MTALLVGLTCALSGIMVFGSACCLAIWAYDRRNTAFPLLGLFCLLVALTEIAGAVSLAHTDAGVADGARFTRAVVFSVATVLAVEATMRLVPGLRLRAVTVAFAVVGLVRVALWWPAAVLLGDDDHPASWHDPEPLMWLVRLQLLLLIVVGVAVSLHGTRWQRVVARLAGIPFAAVIVVSFLGASPGNEVLLSNALVPGGAACLVFAGHLIWRTESARERLARRQRALTALGVVALTGSLDDVRRTAERTLVLEFGVGAGVLVVDGVRPHGTREQEIELSGLRRTVVARLGHEMPPNGRGFVEDVLRIVVTAADRATADADGAHRALHDELTDLPNQVLLLHRLEDRLQRRGGPGVLVAVLSLDGLDRIAAIEGPDRRDAVVTAAATALEAARFPGTTVARTGSDTFALLDYLPEGDPAPYAAWRLPQLRRAVSAAIGTGDTGVTARVGATVAGPEAGAKAAVRDAFVALDRAREDGVALFDRTHAERLHAQVTIQRELAGALSRGEIQVVYQPIVDVATRRTVAAEALARWRRPGMSVPPSEWIPVAEASGLVIDIGRHVLRTAALEQPRLGVPVTVNVSRVQLDDDSFVPCTLDAIGALARDRIVLEVTESTVMADVARSTATLEQLRAEGIRIAMDDFGSSYSSLGALADLPIDILKLDSSFVQRLARPDGVAVIETIVALGRSLGMPVVAEGVETEEQFAQLSRAGVDRVQGFLFGRPADASLVAVATTAPVPTVPAPTAT